MNITQEKIDSLTAVVKVKLGPDDYQAQVDSAVKDYSKKVNMPGFRPGKVPVGMVKKMYGKSILADELNKILNDSIHKYIRDNNIEILGNPLPASEDKLIDWENQKDFEFSYDIGLAPQFDLKLDGDKVPFYTVKVDEDLVSKYVDDLSRRYGKLITPDTSEDKDWLTTDIVELDANGEIVSGGIFKTASIFTERLKDAAIKNKFQGVSVNGKIELKGAELPEEEDVAYFAQLLQVTPEKLKELSLRITIKNINRLTPAELNQELFDKIYGPEVVNSVEEFRAKVREELAKMFVNDSDQKFKVEVKKVLLNKVNLALPDQFLKRWIVAVNEKPISIDQVETEYTNYAEQLKWQLVENKLLKENNIKISDEEAVAFVKELIRGEYAKMGRPDADEAEITNVAHSVLSKEEEGRKIYSQMYDQRLLALYKEKLTIEPKEIPFEEFSKH